MIAGHYLTVHKWVPDFIPANDRIAKTFAWLRLSGMPVEYFNRFSQIPGKRFSRSFLEGRNLYRSFQSSWLFLDTSLRYEVTRP